MIYRFEEDGAGKVVSEAKQPELESFLGQYFPAGDIPQQARALYLKKPHAIISDASGARVAVLPAIDASGEPLDLLTRICAASLPFIANICAIWALALPCPFR